MHRSHAARTMQAAFRGMQGRRRATGIRATRSMRTRIPRGVRRHINGYLRY